MAEAAKELVVKDGKTFFPLSRPIQAHANGTLSELREIALRDPSGEEFFKYGMPIRMISYPDDGQETKIDGPGLRSWIASLSGLNEGDIGAMSPADIMSIVPWLARKLNETKN